MSNKVVLKDSTNFIVELSKAELVLFKALREIKDSEDLVETSKSMKAGLLKIVYCTSLKRNKHGETRI